MLLSALATAINADLEGDPNAEVTACATLDEATQGQVSFIASPKYASKLPATKATAVIVSPATSRPPNGANLLKAKDPYFAFRNAVVTLHGFRQHPRWTTPAPGTEHPLSTGAQRSALISPQSYIHPTATIGEGTAIYPFVFVGPGARIGKDCILYPNVTVYDRCILGDRVILHAGTSVGHDGFGHATHALPGQPPAHHKIPQSGIAILEDDVELGANCSVDRATVGATVIGKGTKFSNNVVIGHGTKVGPHNLFVAQVGIAGSVTTGAYVVLGGQVGVAGHLSIGDQVQVAAQSGIIGDLDPKQNYMGYPALPMSQTRRIWGQVANIDDLAKRVRELERKLADLPSDK